MAEKIISIYDATNGSEIQREMTESELAEYAADAEYFETKEAAKAEKELAKQAVLDKLGLTANEVAALLA